MRSSSDVIVTGQLYLHVTKIELGNKGRTRERNQNQLGASCNVDVQSFEIKIDIQHLVCELCPLEQDRMESEKKCH